MLLFTFICDNKRGWISFLFHDEKKKKDVTIYNDTMILCYNDIMIQGLQKDTMNQEYSNVNNVKQEYQEEINCFIRS